MENQKSATERIKSLAVNRITDLIMDDPMRTWELLNSMHAAITERMHHSNSELDHEALWFLNEMNEHLTLLMLTHSQSDEAKEQYSQKLIERLKDSTLNRLKETAA